MKMYLIFLSLSLTFLGTVTQASTATAISSCQSNANILAKAQIAIETGASEEQINVESTRQFGAFEYEVEVSAEARSTSNFPIYIIYNLKLTKDCKKIKSIKIIGRD